MCVNVCYVKINTYLCNAETKCVNIQLINY